MTNAKLTNATVKALAPRPSDYVQWCRDLPGFGVRVRPSGSRSFIVQYDFGGRKGVTRRVTLGSFPKVDAELARKEAKDILAKARLGVDVAGERAARRAEMTVAELCDEYLLKAGVEKKESTLSTDKGRIERHIKPLLGRKRLSDVTSGDIEQFRVDVTNGKTAIDEKTGKHGRARVTGGAGAATRVIRLLGGIFTYAVRKGYIKENPRRGVWVDPGKSKAEFLNEAELAKLGEALREAETVGIPWQLTEGENSKHRPKKGGDQREVVSPHAVAAIRLLLFTGCRVREVLNMRWRDIHFERGLLNLPTSKTGANKAVWLGVPALEILAGLPRVGEYVIVGSDPTKPRSDLKRPWLRITTHAGLTGWRLHDLRHAYASTGAADNMSLGMIGTLLGHKSTQTTKRYAHLGDGPTVAAANAISNRLAESLRVGLSK
jgi:integrase